MPGYVGLRAPNLLSWPGRRQTLSLLGSELSCGRPLPWQLHALSSAVGSSARTAHAGRPGGALLRTGTRQTRAARCPASRRTPAARGIMQRMGEEIELAAKAIGESMDVLVERSGLLGPVKELSDWVTSYIHYRRQPALARVIAKAADRIRRDGSPRLPSRTSCFATSSKAPRWRTIRSFKTCGRICSQMRSRAAILASCPPCRASLARWSARSAVPRHTHRPGGQRAVHRRDRYCGGGQTPGPETMGTRQPRAALDFPRFRGHLSAWVERPGQGGSSAQIEAAVSPGVPS